MAQGAATPALGVIDRAQRTPHGGVIDPELSALAPELGAGSRPVWVRRWHTVAGRGIDERRSDVVDEPQHARVDDISLGQRNFMQQRKSRRPSRPRPLRRGHDGVNVRRPTGMKRARGRVDARRVANAGAGGVREGGGIRQRGRAAYDDAGRHTTTRAGTAQRERCTRPRHDEGVGAGGSHPFGLSQAAKPR